MFPWKDWEKKAIKLQWKIWTFRLILTYENLKLENNKIYIPELYLLFRCLRVVRLFRKSRTPYFLEDGREIYLVKKRFYYTEDITTLLDIIPVTLGRKGGENISVVSYPIS